MPECIAKPSKKGTGTSSREREGLFPGSSPHPETGELMLQDLASRGFQEMGCGGGGNHHHGDYGSQGHGQGHGSLIGRP